MYAYVASGLSPSIRFIYISQVFLFIELITLVNALYVTNHSFDKIMKKIPTNMLIKIHHITLGHYNFILILYLVKFYIKKQLAIILNIYP